jgi:tRNA(Arg) A34 adenosine deaminase TadA
MQDSELMGLALAEAALALAEREVPVGCVFARADGSPLARAHNRTNALFSPLMHAEVVALHALVEGLPRDARDVAGALRALLADATLYVTVEPCIMCADALLRAGVRRVVYGCSNDKFGGCGTVVDVFGGREEGGGAASSAGGSSGEGSAGAGAAAGPEGSAGGSSGRRTRKGVRADEAVALLKQFYTRSNERT